MKQSQNAITFLRAQYRAVYGRAYRKGLASVMVLSSAMVGSYAQAADLFTQESSTGDGDFNTAAQDALSNEAAELTAAIARSEIFTGEEFDARSVLDSLPEWQSAATTDAVVNTAGAVEVSYTSAFTPSMVRSTANSAANAAVRSSAPSVDMQGNDVLTASVLDGYAPVTPAAAPVSAEPREQALAVDPTTLPELGTSGVHNELTVGNTSPTKFSQGSHAVNTIIFQGGTLKLGDTVNSSGLDFTVSDVYHPDLDQILTNKLEFNTESGDNIIDVAGNSAGSVTLDLTQANISYTGSGSGNTTVNVGSQQGYQSATVNIDQDGLDALLQGNTSGTGQTVINLNSGGILSAGGNINVNLGDLTSSSAGQVTPQQGINFNGGTLEVDSLTVVQDGKQADLGSSSLNQDKLLLSGSGNFAFIGGNINLTPEANTTNPIIGAANGETGQTLQIGTAQSNTDKNAAFNFTGQDGSDYTIEPETIYLQSSATGAANTTTASVTVSGGNWQAQNINASGVNNRLNVNGDNTTFTGNDLSLEQDSALATNGSGDIAFTNVSLGSGSNLNLGNETFTITGSGDFTQGNLAGTANVVLSGTNANNRASANLTATQFNNYLSGGGEFTLDGGADFTVTGPEEIDLGQYHLDADAAGSGDIHVIAPADPTTGNNTFTAENVAISQELTSDPTPLALDIHATTLTLGGATYNDVNSDGIGAGALHAHNVNFDGQSGANGTENFVLRDELNLDAPAITPTPPATDTTGTGTISGSVVLAGGPDNSLKVNQGYYTQNGDLTLASGSLQVGGDSVASTNASLTVTGTINIDNTAGSNVINVQANAAGTTASLDFTGNTLDLQRGDNLTTINVGNNAQFTVTGSQVTDDLLAGPDTPADTTLGAGVILDSGADMVIVGKSTLDVGTFQSGDAAQSDKIVFNNGGQVTVNGELALTNTNNGVADFGAGTVAVKDGLKLSGDAANPTDFVLGQGTLRVNVSNPANVLVSSANGNEVLTIGNGDASTGAAHLILGTGFREANAQPLTVQSNLALNGNGANSATVTFRGNTTSVINDPHYDATTEYNAQSITVSGDNNTINIGDGAHTATTLTAKDISLESGAALNVNIGDGASTATLTAQDINLGDSSTLDLNSGAANVTNVTLSSGSTLNLNNESLTVTGSGDFTQGALAGSGNLVVSGDAAQASFTDNNLQNYLAGSGDVTLQSGADLNLSSADPAIPVNLNQFAFDDGAAGGSGDIHVIDDGNQQTANSRVTGENLLISSPLHDSDLALDIEATHLTLGDSTHNSADDINGLGVDKLYAQGVTFVGYNDGAGNSSDFVLRDELNLDAPAITPTPPATDTTGTGTISGNVVLAGGPDNSLKVNKGYYTQSGDLTLASGSLQVGGDSTATTNASLTVNGDFKLDNTSGNNIINVQANGAGTEATLDLSQVTASTVTPDTNGTYLTTINVGSTPAPSATPSVPDSHVKVTTELANNLLNGDAGAVNLGASGELDIGSGDVTLATGDLLSGATAAAGQVAFNNGGVLSADGLNLSGSGDINIGAGTINANRLDLTNTTQNATDATFAGGNFNIADELTSTNTNIVVGNGTNTTNVTLGAFTPDPTDPTNPDTAVVSGSLGGNPGTISSNVVVNASGSLNVQQGSWTLNNESGDLTVNQGELVIGAVNAVGNAYQVYDAQGSGTAVTAEITGNALNLNGADITVNSTGTANFDSLITDATSGSNVLVSGGTINIENDVSLNSGDSIIISGATGTVSFGSGAAHHITANADGTLNVESGSFANVFDLQNGGNLKLDLGDQTFTVDQIKELRKTLLADANPDGSAKDPVDGYIHLGGAQLDGAISDEMTAVSISNYDPNDPVGSIIDFGVDELPSGSVVVPGLSANNEVLAELADIKDIRTDALDDVLLYDINSDQAAGNVTVVTGNVGALMVITGDHAVINESSLAHAYENGNSNGNRYFIASQTDGTLLGATVQSGGLLNLENGGYIGEVVLEDGNSANDKTTLTINTRNPDKTYGSGDDGITYIEGNVSGGANTAFNIHDVTVVSGDVTIGELNNTSDLTVNGTTLTVSGGTFANTGSITLNNGDVNHTGGDFTNSGTINSANNVNVTGGNILLGDNSSITAAGSGTFSGNTVAMGGTNTFGGDVTVTGTDVSFTSGSNLSTSAGNVTVTGESLAFGDNTSISTASGNLAFTANTGDIDLDTITTTFSGNTISFTANSGDVSLGENSTLQGESLALTGQNVTVAGNHDFAGSGNFTATAPSGSVNIGAGNQSFAQGATFSGTSISLNSGANVSSTGDLTFTGNTTQDSGSTLQGNNASFTGDTTLNGTNTFTGTGTFSGGNIAFNGQNSFGGNVTVDGDQLSFGSGASITSSSGDLTFTANSSDINLSGSNTTFSGNSISFTANSGDVTLGTGTNLHGTNLNLTGQNVHVAGNQTFAGSGSFTATNTTNGAIAVGAGNQTFAQGATFSGTTINLDSGANINTGSGDLAFTGNTTQNSSSTLRGGNVSFTGDTTLNGTNIFTGTGTFSGGTVNFGGQNSFGQGAEVNATSVNINAGSNLVAGSGSGNVTASGDIKFTGASNTQGSWSFTGTNINLAADSRVSNSGDLSFSGTTTQESGGRLIGTTISFNGDTKLGGYVTATTLNVGNGTTQIDNTLEVQNLNVDSGTTTLLGSNSKIDNLVVTAAAGGSGASNVVQFGTDDPNFSGQTTATVSTLQLNGNTLYTDPIYGKAATLVTIEQGQPYNPNGGSGSTSSTQTVLDGDLIIGKNSAVAWGAPTTGTNLLVNDVAPYQDANGSLQTGASGMYGSILVLNKPMVVSDGSQIVLNSDSTTTGVDDTRAIATLADGREADLALSANSLLIVKVDAVGATDAQNTPAIHFDKQGAVITAASGSTIVLKGNYDLRTGIDVFTDGDASGSTGVELVGADVTVTSENGLLTSLLTEEPSNNVGHIQLRTTRELINQKFNRVSNPVRDTLADYYNTTVSSAGTSNFLNGVLTTDSDGSSAEVAARMGVYGGAVQSALAVNDAATDAVARRTGVGEAAPGGSYFKASGPVDMWFNPVYQRNESDGFSAEGVDYGTDINLYGFNAGSELNLVPGLKVGAQINVGTGDAEGNGLASGVSNDFDYYGLGVYGALQTKNLTLVGDINYTKVSNDISANTHIDNLNTSVDSESLSLGVTGKLEYDVNRVKIMPHAGLRYQRLDMDDYNVNSTKYGQVAHYGSETLNLLSLPVGVTLYKNLITADGWHLKPAIDFTATWNFGDTDADGNVSWTGSTMHTGLSTEVLDPLTFGINAGISARKDRLTVGVGVSYTGSSNTSELGLQGNVKYTF